MTHPAFHRVLVVSALCGLGACASIPADRGQSQVDDLLVDNGLHATAADRPSERQAQVDARLARPLDADAAVEIAWLESPRVRIALASLGLAAADLFESGRLRNPRFSASRIGGSDGKTTLGISAIVSDLLTLPSRQRLGRSRWQAALAQTAHTLIDEAAATRADYYTHVGAQQIAAMRDAVAEAAEVSVELARRFHAAGNISALQLAREEAAASVARVQAARAHADRFATRMALAERLGLAGRTNRWQTAQRLPMPPEDDPDTGTLLALAQERRLDVAAARAALDAGEDAATFAQRYGWLGDIELGFERESEDGKRESGPFLALELPLFQHGQAGVARAQSGRDVAREHLDLYALSIERQVRTGGARLATQRAIVAGYRDALIPQRERIVAGELERYNFMLIGAFELIQARQQEFDAYQGYLEAIRDYWLARVELARAVGGRLPDDDASFQRAPGVDELLGPLPTPANGHEHHGGDDPTSTPTDDDPHAAHRNHGDRP